MSAISLSTLIALAKLLCTRQSQLYNVGPCCQPNVSIEEKSADIENICAAITSTIGNLYHVPSPGDYDNYVQNIAPVTLATVRGHVAKGQPILMAVFASQLSKRERYNRNGTGQTRDTDLAHLNNVCRQISSIYLPGANVAVVMDGLLHNDLLGVGDLEEWEKVKEMKDTIAARCLTNLRAVPVWDLLQDDHDDMPLRMDDEARQYFLHHAQALKEHLLSRFGSLDTNSESRHQSFEFKNTKMSQARYIVGERKRINGMIDLRVQVATGTLTPASLSWAAFSSDVLGNILESILADHVYISL